jgi:pimeloyl-ACP methyl ester carboxylesterase
MTGSKAAALSQWADQRDCNYTRFDYSGHGQSEGKFEGGTIGQWIKDALYILDNHTTGSQIVAGSSMGGWIALHLALLRPEKVTGLLGIASAPDFTEELIWNVISENTREKLMRDGVFYEPPKYDSEPTPMTKQLIEDGRKHLLLNRETLPITCPIRLIHGMGDKDVPWEFSQRILKKAQSENISLHLIKDGDHRLSRDQDIKSILALADDLAFSSR